MNKRALIFTDNTEGIESLVEFLHKEDWEITSAGVTAEIIKALNIPVKIEKSIASNVQYNDGFISPLQQIMSTGQRFYYENESNDTFSLVCVNIDLKFRQLTEFLEIDFNENCIDLKSISLIRAAAKNYKQVIVLTDPADYKETMIQIKTNSVTTDYRLFLAGKALNLTAAYDATIAQSILVMGNEIPYPNYMLIPYKKKQELLHGTNRQQTAAVYNIDKYEGAFNGFKKIQGPEMTFNTIRNIHTAWKEITFFFNTIKNPFSVESLNHEGRKFTTQFTPAAGTVFTVGIKNATPIGASLGSSVLDSFLKTFNSNQEDFQNSIIGCSSVVDENVAAEMMKINILAIIAPDFTKEAKAILSERKDLRLFVASKPISGRYESISLDGGMLIQSIDEKLFNKWNIVTQVRPTQEQIDSMAFGMLIALTTKSYSSIIVKDRVALGISTGQTSIRKAILHAIEDSKYYLKNSLTSEQNNTEVLICDSVIHFDDRLKTILDTGIKAIIQTGGSQTDSEFINFCDEHGIAMVFTGMQHLSF